MMKKNLLKIFTMMIMLAITFNVYAVELPLDGNYKVEITFAGGTAKVTAKSPVDLTVSDGEMTAKIILTSSNYTYMIVDGIQYDNTATTGQDSTFIIPISALDTEIDIIACTVAMSSPHEIEYTIKLSSEGTISHKDTSQDTEQDTNQNIVNNSDDSKDSTSEDIDGDSEKEISKDDDGENLEATSDINEKDNKDEEINLENITAENDENEIENNNIQMEVSGSTKAIIAIIFILAVIVAGIIFKKRKSSNI